MQYNFWRDREIQQKAHASAIIASSGNGQENGQKEARRYASRGIPCYSASFFQARYINSLGLWHIGADASQAARL
jgi:hypothetical protein